jgi:hypothetical protein
MHEVTDATYRAIIGLDWADTKHDVGIQPADGETREFQRFVYRPKMRRHLQPGRARS